MPGGTLSDRTPSDEPAQPPQPAQYEPTAKLRPDDQTVTPLQATEELGTPGDGGEETAVQKNRPSPKPIVISSTPEPLALSEDRRLQAKQRIDDRRGESSSRKGGVPVWIWIAGGVLLLLLAIMFFASRGSDDGREGSDAGGGGAGVLEADGTNLLSLGGKKGGLGPDELRALEGETVSGEGVKVQSVVSDEGFWVGSSERKRFFVFLAIEGESGPKISAGDVLDLTGELRPVPLDFRDRFGLGKSSGAGQLEAQGLYLEVSEIPQAG